MNAITKMVLRAFFLPFAACLSILFVILIMDALAIHLSSIAGSGLSFGSFLRLIGFSFARVVVVAISLSILAAALLGSRSLAENHEWNALKSSGIGLFQAVKPLLLFSVLASLFCFWFGSEVVPRATLNFKIQLYKIQHTEPTAGLSPGRFFEGIPGYVIRVGQKDRGSDLLKNILIYSSATKDTAENRSVLIAESGKIQPKAGKVFITLYKGNRHEEFEGGYATEDHFRLGRTYFDSLRFSIPLPPIPTGEAAEKQFHNHTTRRRAEMIKWISKLKREKAEIKKYADQDKSPGLDEDAYHSKVAWVKHQLPRFRYEYGTMFALPLTCIIYMLVGLALGSVIKSRGKGIGTPALSAVILFMVFYLLKAQGERLGKANTIDPSLAAWLPVLVFGPFAVYLLWKANRS